LLLPLFAVEGEWCSALTQQVQEQRQVALGAAGDEEMFADVLMALFAQSLGEGGNRILRVGACADLL